MNLKHTFQVMSFDPLTAKISYLKTNDFEEAQLALADSLIAIDNSPCTYTGQDEEQYQQWEMYIEECRLAVQEYGIQPKVEVVA